MDKGERKEKGEKGEKGKGERREREERREKKEMKEKECIQQCGFRSETPEVRGRRAEAGSGGRVRQSSNPA